MCPVSNLRKRNLWSKTSTQKSFSTLISIHTLVPIISKFMIHIPSTSNLNIFLIPFDSFQYTLLTFWPVDITEKMTKHNSLQLLCKTLAVFHSLGSQKYLDTFQTFNWSKNGKSRSLHSLSTTPFINYITFGNIDDRIETTEKSGNSQKHAISPKMRYNIRKVITHAGLTVLKCIWIRSSFVPFIVLILKHIHLA